MDLLKTILLPLDFTISIEYTMVIATELAKVFQSRLSPTHVLPDDISNEKINAFLRSSALEKLKAAASRIKDEGVGVADPVLEYGAPYEAIVRAAVKVDANLVLIGSGQTLKGDKFQLGTTTTRIIQKSEKPVFVVKEGTPLSIQSIICPIDFSHLSKRALKNAITLAHKFKVCMNINMMYLTAYFGMAKVYDRINDI